MGICGHHCDPVPKVAYFQVVFDGHQPEYPGDFTSVEQTVDEVTQYLNVHGIPIGCCLAAASLGAVRV